MNNALAATSQRAAEIFGATTPAGARFESSAELLNLVSAALQQAMHQWRQTLTTRQSAPSHKPPQDDNDELPVA